MVFLPFDGPLDVAAALKWLAAHATPGVDAVVGNGYRRALEVGLLDVRLVATGAEVSVLEPARPPSADELRRVRFVLDLDRDIVAVESELSRHDVLRPLVRGKPGLRVMGAWSPWEALIRVVLGQQVSVAGARTLAGRVARIVGVPASPNGRAGIPGDEPHLVFPGPAELAVADLTGVGLTGARSRAITGLARAVDSGSLAPGPEGHRGGGTGWLADLARQPGVGPWTISYLAMRVLRDADAWPAGDLVLRRACAAAGIDIAEAGRRFRPWRAYAATHLWESTWGVRPAA